jgi:hypothetical protein
MSRSIGSVQLRPFRRGVPTSGVTVSRTNATGRQDVYRLTDRGGLTAELADVTWDNGEWEVRMLSCEGPPQVRRLEHGLRSRSRRPAVASGAWGSGRPGSS